MMMTMMTTNTDINPDDLIKHHCFSFDNVYDELMMNDFE